MFRLDGQQLSADMGAVRRRIFELAAKRWRLLSERDGLMALGAWIPPASGRDDAVRMLNFLPLRKDHDGAWRHHGILDDFERGPRPKTLT
jgi:hypothetical protein